mmetsp:Transcript_6753/g.17283  ORF Transcript_6753/g.17283 Transcript_6753/m.17283 type:complete len:437 (-) Transcript_6753:214-1524(-)
MGVVARRFVFGVAIWNLELGKTQIFPLHLFVIVIITVLQAPCSTLRRARLHPLPRRGAQSPRPQRSPQRPRRFPPRRRLRRGVPPSIWCAAAALPSADQQQQLRSSSSIRGRGGNNSDNLQTVLGSRGRGRPLLRSRAVVTRTMAAPVPIMVNDLTGKMGRAVADAVVARGGDTCFLVPVAFSGRAKPPVDVSGVMVEVSGLAGEGSNPGAVLEELKQKYPGLVVVDYTLPKAVNANADLYMAHGVPFVMGTTGGDRVKLFEDVRAAAHFAIIAPQMGKQVVAFQAAMKLMAENFPGAFKGCKLTVTESHQSSKVDTSGTAKALVESFNGLGCEFGISEVELVRDVPTQLGAMGVPEEHLVGHAFHTYRLTSPDGTVSFEFQHNVCGRSIYAEGTVDAALFLSNMVGGVGGAPRRGGGKTVYDMIDVLKEGGMVTN